MNGEGREKRKQRVDKGDDDDDDTGVKNEKTCKSEMFRLTEGEEAARRGAA